MTDYTLLQYKLGFFASTTRDAPVVNPSWRTWRSGELRVSYDGELPFATASTGSALVVVLGRIVSLALPPGPATIQHLADQLAVSETAFHTAMDACAGRFVCVYVRDGEVQIVGDATGMKMICYATSPEVAVASHATLLAETLGKPESANAADFVATAQVRDYNMSFLPGLATAYEGVRMLAPNCALSFRTGQLHRVFPRAPIMPLPYEEALELACDRLRELADKFVASFPVAASITAGLDSRLTAAAFHAVRDRMTFFTYVRRGEKVNVVDAVIAKRVASATGLTHRELFFDHEASDGDYQQFAAIARRNHRFEHFYSLAYAYLANHPAGVVHVRSNMGEICRARYHTDPFDGILGADDSELDKLVKIFCTWTKAKPHPFITREFARYLEDTDLLAQAHGIDLYPLYYWELLMPVWHGGLLLESDTSHDTVSLFNCRTLLATYLAMPFAKQLTGDGMLDSIRRLCPAMLDEPINPEVSELRASEVEPYEQPRPMLVRAVRTADAIRAEVMLADGHFSGPVEYAFYLFQGADRIATQAYGARNEAVFAVDAPEQDRFEVTGFAREIAHPERKLSKRIPVREP